MRDKRGGEGVSSRRKLGVVAQTLQCIGTWSKLLWGNKVAGT